MCIALYYFVFADLGLDFCPQSAESLQESLVLWFDCSTSLHIFKGHVQLS